MNKQNNNMKDIKMKIGTDVDDIDIQIKIDIDNIDSLKTVFFGVLCGNSK